MSRTKPAFLKRSYSLRRSSIDVERVLSPTSPWPALFLQYQKKQPGGKSKPLRLLYHIYGSFKPLYGLPPLNFD